MESKFSLPGIVCDIDGVLVRDKGPLPTAADTIRLIKKPLKELAPNKYSGIETKIPLVCLTNGGGLLEKTKAESLNKILELNGVSEEFQAREILMNHTALRPIMNQYSDHLVIVTGGGEPGAIARDCGISKWLTLEEYASLYPDMVPVTAKNTPHSVVEEIKKNLAPRLGIEKLDELDKPLQVHAIFILNDPLHWYEYLQVICDLLGTTNGTIAEKAPQEAPVKHIPIYCTNNDLVYAGKFPLPRITFGAFNECLKHLYKIIYKKSLEIQHYGKPFEVTYRYAETHLKELAGTELSNIYMIGDNPKSDIRGARAAGWKTILVETGVFQRTSEVDNDPHDPADYVVANVQEAINLILQLEGIRN